MDLCCRDIRCRLSECQIADTCAVRIIHPPVLALLLRIDAFLLSHCRVIRVFFMVLLLIWILTSQLSGTATAESTGAPHVWATRSLHNVLVRNWHPVVTRPFHSPSRHTPNRRVRFLLNQASNDARLVSLDIPRGILTARAVFSRNQRKPMLRQKGKFAYGMRLTPRVSQAHQRPRRVCVNPTAISPLLYLAFS